MFQLPVYPLATFLAACNFADGINSISQLIGFGLQAIALYQQREPQGEYTLVVAGTPATQPLLTEAELKAELQQLISQGISRSQASRQLAKFTSLSRRQIYQLALSI